LVDEGSKCQLSDIIEKLTISQGQGWGRWFADGLSSVFVFCYVTDSLNEFAIRHPHAMVTDLRASDHGRAARLIPVWIALVNGMSPLMISLVIMLPLWLANAIDGFPVDPLIASVIVTLIIIFLLGVFLGRIGASFWLWAGLRTLLLALLTCGIILLVSTV
jgi:predicted membrane protein (TIGR00267 family)